MSNITLRPMCPDDYPAVAQLIHTSTNDWFMKNRGFNVFPGPPESLLWFCNIYEALDPNCCILAIDSTTQTIAGSCFYHPRPTHIALGIMNVHPQFFSRGIARKLLNHITNLADTQNLPTRLTSSAMNLDSFSLYTKAGFIPHAFYQDMQITKPLPPVNNLPPVRPATLNDVDHIANLERELTGIHRPSDFHFMIKNTHNIWRVFVTEDHQQGGNTNNPITACLASVEHPSSAMLGPGIARNAASALALIHAQLSCNWQSPPVFLAPVNQPELINQLYQWGAKNLGLSVTQVRGHFTPFKAINFPTFFPETG